ncbi:MAG: hypothetical protein ACTHQM_24765 [Thermoanaerobaculia bacterium]
MRAEARIEGHDVREMESGLLIVASSRADLTDEQTKAAIVRSIGKPTDDAERAFCEEVKEGMRLIADPDYGEAFMFESVEYKIYRMFAPMGIAPEAA